MTVDKSQGIDKDCIIVLFPVKGVNQLFLNSWERINVAFTRAKKKLLILGNFEDLRQVEVLKEFFKVFSEKKWVYDLGKDVVRSVDADRKTRGESGLEDMLML